MHAPFDLLFVDGGGAKDDPDAVLRLATPGATIVLDDFSVDRTSLDPRRDAWCAHPRLVSVALGTREGREAIVATVRR